MAKSCKIAETKRKATVRIRKPKPEQIFRIEFKFLESEVKHFGGVNKLSDFVYSCVEAAKVGVKN